MKTALIGALLVLLAGCGKHESRTEAAWTPEQLDTWVAKARAECKPNGLAVDSAGRGYFLMREVLTCPDGTIRIVPMR